MPIESVFFVGAVILAFAVFMLTLALTWWRAH